MYGLPVDAVNVISPSFRSVVIIVASLEIISNTELWVVLGFRYIPISSLSNQFPLSSVRVSAVKPVEIPVATDGNGVE